MTERTRYERVLAAVSRFLVIFAVVAFFITTSLMLFISVMTAKLNIILTNSDIELAAKLTLLNVLVLTVIFTCLDLLRRRISVEKPAARIIEAASKMKKGDFSVRIAPRRTLMPNDSFAEIEICFNSMAEELASTETLRQDFIANVSHELKTPLAVIKNYAAILRKEGLSDEERLEYLAAIDRSVSRLSSLVSNILKLSKLENSRITPMTTAFNLGEQVSECFLGFEEVWEEKELIIETDIDDSVTVRSDPEMLSIIWNNLISNAIKFTEKGGSVFLSVKADEDYATVKIRDTGIGMSQETGARIFEKFYQGDTSRAVEGNGLGLALVKEAVELVGCEIAVESEIGAGTEFTVRLRRSGA